MISVKKLLILWFCILQFIPVLIIGAEAARQIKNIAIAELNDYLVNSEELTITVNGQIIEEKDTIISEFKKPFQLYSYHHSNPTDSILIAFHKSDNVFEILLRQDSHEPNEYWIYLPKYNSTAKNEVGKIRTKRFSQYIE